MSVPFKDLQKQLVQIDKQIAELLNGASAADSADQKAARKAALKELNEVRAQVVLFRAEAQAAELAGLASPVKAAAVRAERRKVEQVLAAFKKQVVEVIETVREMIREFEPEPIDAGEPVVEPAPPVVEDALAADPTLLRRTSSGHLVFGHLVGAMQVALTANGHDTNGIDLWFGGDTEGALEAWHAATGSSHADSLSLSEWLSLTGRKAPDLFDLCAQVTAAFEGHGFTKAVGDFDGAVATWGYHGFTLKYGHLQAVLQQTEVRKPGTIIESFGATRGAQLIKMLDQSLARQISWGRRSLLGAGGTMKPEWVQGFNEIGRRRDCQEAQLAYSRAQFWEKIARPQIERLELREALSCAMIFDTAIQQGGLGRSSMTKIEQRKAQMANAPERELRKVIAKVATEAVSKGRFRDDVRSRRNTFVDGRGRVHGKSFNLLYWGLLAAFDEREAPLAEMTDPEQEVQSFAEPQDFESFFEAMVKPHAPNFSAAEFLKMGAGNSSGTCAGKNAPPPKSKWENCIELAKVLQALRDDAGAPVKVLGMYRSPQYNACVGGASKSQHMEFKAADIRVDDGHRPSDWARRLKKLRGQGLFRGGIGVYKTFLHVDTRGTNATWSG